MTATKSLLTALIVVCVFACTACNLVTEETRILQTEKEGDERMQVELDIFSGRPNPQWTLTPQQSDEWDRLLQELPEGRADGEPPPGLGYRGFIVNPLDDRSQGCDESHVFRESVTVKQECASTQLVDRNRTLERFLLGTSQDHIEQNLYEQLQTEIDG